MNKLEKTAKKLYKAAISQNINYGYLSKISKIMVQ